MYGADWSRVKEHVGFKDENHAKFYARNFLKSKPTSTEMAGSDILPILKEHFGDNLTQEIFNKYIEAVEKHGADTAKIKESLGLYTKH